MTDQTPDDKKPQADTPPVTSEKAGFKAAAEPEAEAGTDPLAAQEAVDRVNAERLAEQQAEAEGQPAAQTTETTTPSALPLSAEGAEEQVLNDQAQQVLANAQCVKAIAALFGRDDLMLKEYLEDLTVVAETENGLFLKGVDNEFTLSKDIIQAEQETISAKAAFDMAILAFNNPAFDEQGIDLTGNLRDRYMLTLAANHIGLKISNPVTEIPDDLKAEFAQVKAEWDALVANPGGVEPAAVEEVAVEEPAAPIEQPAAVETMPVTKEATPATDTPPLDEHYNKAVELVVNSGTASKAFLQRSLHVGFNRASRLVESLERQGIIGPANSAGKREVLVHPTDVDKTKYKLTADGPAQAPRQP